VKDAEPIRKISLMAMLVYLFSLGSDDIMFVRCMLLVLYHSIGRAGEVSTMNFRLLSCRESLGQTADEDWPRRAFVRSC